MTEPFGSLYDKQLHSYSNAQLKKFIDEMSEELSDRGASSQKLTHAVGAALSSTTLRNHAAFGDLISAVNIGRFWFSQDQLLKFIDILIDQYGYLKFDTQRMHVLSLLMNVLGYEVAAEKMLKILDQHERTGLPISELVWELHHMKRRGEVSGDLAKRIQLRLDQIAGEAG